jgi:O-acetylhomoserine/O-acetylserine sulfhydrylase-like pyridoxal-dependent enzyme
LLEVSGLPLLASIAHSHGVPLVVDNTLCLMILSPLRLGADTLERSVTKFMNCTL